jgi:hypothetical protein
VPSLNVVPEDVAAVIYDLPKERSIIDFRWLKSAALPVVVLTPDRRLQLPKSSRQHVLEYPVRMDQILKALLKLGVCTGEAC